jgi:hypothetical protein
MLCQLSFLPQTFIIPGNQKDWTDTDAVCKMSMQRVNEKDSAPGMREIQAGLEQLERREWWRWATALLIMLLLTLGVLSLAVPGARKDAFSQYPWNMAVPGLFGLVLLFAALAVTQQVRISRLRRQLSSQIGMLAALEVLKPAAPDDQKGWKERRRAPRRPFDQRLIIKAMVEGKEAILYGRIIDISELGLGAVISGSLNRGEAVSLEFSAGPGSPTLCLAAVIRCARGFRHGFEFSGLSAAEAETLRACFEEFATTAQ